MDKTCRRCGRDDGSPVSYYHDSCFDGPKMEVENHLLREQNAELLAACKLGGFELGPCQVCGTPIVFLEDGLSPTCENCIGLVGA